jgi:hypothetical protein
MIPENIKLLIDLTLGDGWIGYNGSSVRGRIEHSIMQQDYALHKAELLQAAGFPLTIRVYESTTKKNAGRSYCQVNLHTHPDLHTAHKYLYNKGRKAIDKSLLRAMDDRSLAYLFMDDGCAHRIWYNLKEHTKYMYSEPKIHSFKLSTNGFTHEENVLLADWLLSLGIASKLERQGTTYRTVIAREASKDRFVELVSPYVVPSMSYKLAGKRSFRDIPFIVVPRDVVDRNRLSEGTLVTTGDATVE